MVVCVYEWTAGSRKRLLLLEFLLLLFFVDYLFASNKPNGNNRGFFDACRFYTLSISAFFPLSSSFPHFSLLTYI